jgi:predicted MFS family arabinose efflux permease
MFVNQQLKNLTSKMIDFKRFGMVLLAIGVFFFLGVIIPSENKDPMDLNIMILASMSSLAVSIFFFIQSKQCEMKINEMEEAQE